MGITTVIYAWSDQSQPGNIKFGDHTIDGVGHSQSAIEKNTKKYIRKNLNRQKYLYDTGLITVHWVREITEYAKSVGRNFKQAKIDNYIAKNTDLRLHRIQDDFYRISLAELNGYVNRALTGKFKLNSYSPHKYQVEAIDKAVKYFDDTSRGSFLLDCVMRFGKCFTSYQIAKQLGTKRILVITGRPKVKDGWRDDLDHVDFDGWKFIDSQTKDNVKFFETNQLFIEDEPVAEVIFASFQGGNRDESRIKQVIEQDIDLVIVDEAHAYFSPDAMKFVSETLKANHRLWVSGTPFKAYQSGMFDGTTDTYRFTLVDLLRVKRQVEKDIKNNIDVEPGVMRFAEFPNIQILVSEYPDFGSDTTLFEQNESLNMRTLLSNSAGIPNYPAQVQGLLDTFTGNGVIASGVLNPPKRGKNAVAYPVTAEHIWMAVPAGVDDTKAIPVASATTLETVIKQHSVGHVYDPLTIKGDKNQDDVNNHITLSKQAGRKTINISCRSLNTGTKFPDLDTVIFLTETTSAAEFWQTVGRVLQPSANKKSATIICYSIEMIVNMANKMVEYSATDSLNHSQLCSELLDMMPVFSMIKGVGVRQLNVNEMYKTLSSRGSVRDAFGDREILSVDFDRIVKSDPNFFESIPDVNSESEPTSVLIAKSGQRGKNAKISRIATPRQQKDLVNQSRERVREFLKQIGSVMAASAVYDGIIIQGVKDLKKINPNTVDSELYPGTTAIITKLIDKGALNIGVFDKKIGAFHTVEIEPKLTWK